MVGEAATAEGDLERTPFAHLLVYVLDKKLTGALILAPPEGPEHVVRLVRGVPVKVRPGDRHALLGEMLVEAGLIDDKTLEGALATPGLLGDILLLSGRIERDALEQVAEAQFVRRMVRLFSLPPATVYRYYDERDDLADYGGDPSCVDPLALMWAGIRAHGDASTMIEGTLARLGDADIKLHPAATVSRFGLDDEEDQLFAVLRDCPLSLAELTEASSPDVARRFVYALAITRQLSAGGTGPLPLGADPGPVSSGRTGTLTPASGSQLARMNLRSTVHRQGAAAPDLPGDGERSFISRRLRDRTGAESDEPPSSRQRDDPERPRASTDDRGEGSPTPTEPPISSVKPLETTAPSMVDSGVIALPKEPPPPAPQAADEAPPPFAAPSEEPAAAKDAETTPAEAKPVETTEPDPYAGLSAKELFELATVRLNERDVPGATAACEAGRKAAPNDPDLAALDVWMRAKGRGADVKALSIELDELLGAHEGHVAGRFYRAMLRKRLGREDGCASDLRQVLALDPAHAGATRELAALEAKQEPEERQGLLGRLFRR